jgi:hypothetical protein
LSVCDQRIAGFDRPPGGATNVAASVDGTVEQYTDRWRSTSRRQVSAAFLLQVSNALLTAADHQMAPARRQSDALPTAAATAAVSHH